jgi:hypothetical protein
MIFIKILLWVLIGVAVTGLAFWMVVSPWFPKDPGIEFLVLVFFSMPAMGAFWMLYVAIRNERHPLPIVLLAFLPYTFLWYYSERVRHGKHKTRVLTEA